MKATASNPRGRRYGQVSAKLGLLKRMLSRGVSDRSCTRYARPTSLRPSRVSGDVVVKTCVYVKVCIRDYSK